MDGTTTIVTTPRLTTAGIDVRLTQLRNLLAGTRPQTIPIDATTGAINGDNNYVFYTTARASGAAVFHAQRHRGANC